MVGNITPHEYMQIEQAVGEQINKVTHNAFIKEQQNMLQEGHPLPTQVEMPNYLFNLRLAVLNTLLQSN